MSCTLFTCTDSGAQPLELELELSTYVQHELHGTANEPQVKKAGFDLEVRRFSRTISKVAQTVTNTRRIRRFLEALVSRPEL